MERTASMARMQLRSDKKQTVGIDTIYMNAIFRDLANKCCTLEEFQEWHKQIHIEYGFEHKSLSQLIVEHIGDDHFAQKMEFFLECI
jgi:hypothetical protein